MFRNRAFTIIELLIVIAVIAILVGIALPRFKGMQDEGNIAKAKGELRTLQTAIESYYIHNSNAYPAALTTLTSAIPNIIGSALPTDPFKVGTNYVLATDGATPVKYYVIYSVGTAGTGTASVTTAGVASDSESSVIYVTNGAPRDTTP
ncbi:MAG: type II secretion system protein [Candidatus Omnitrophota bacterium]